MISSVKTYIKYRIFPKLGISEYWFDFWTKVREQLQQLRYSAPAHPKKVIYVNPQKVNKEVKGICKTDGLGQIVAGNWELVDLRERSAVMGLIQRFKKGYDWEETVLYSDVKSKFSSRGEHNGYDSFEQWKKVRLKYIDELHEDIKNEGYKPNIKYGHRVPNAGSRIERNKHNSEPWVGIGSDGTIYWREGFHRYTIASICGIENIPVYVLARHKEWQLLREELSNSRMEEIPTKKKKFLNHPDMQDI